MGKNTGIAGPGKLAVTPKPTSTPKPTATPKVTPTPTVTPTSTPTKIFNPQGKPADSNAAGNYSWISFINGDLASNPAKSVGAVMTTAYISQGVEPVNTEPNPVVIVPSGNGYRIIKIDNAINEFLQAIPKNRLQEYKVQLQAYYSSSKGYKQSVTQPITDKDIEFQQAIRRALLELTLDNYNNIRTQILSQTSANPELLKNPSLIKTPINLYTFDSYVFSRTSVPQGTSSGESVSSLTYHDDAIAEFKRTVQLYVGDPALINNLDALAEEYFVKLNKEEEKRISSRTGTSDALGNTQYTSESWAQLTDQDKLEMRLGFITKGGPVSKSIGISKVEPLKLQDAGGLIGDTYTKLKGFAFDYGVRFTHEQLIAKATEALLPGGQNGEGMASGLEQQKRTIQLASRAIYKSLSPYIEGGLKVSDIAGQFQKLKQDELELADGSVDVFDSDVQSAITGDKLLTPDELTMKVRTNPNWRKTKKANESGTEFLNSLLQLWGKV